MENTPAPPPSPSPPPLKPLTPTEWESLIDDHHHGGSRRDRWISSHYTGQPLFDLILSSLLRKDLPPTLKLLITTFLEQHHPSIIILTSHNLSRLVDTLRHVISSPNDAVSVTSLFKEQLIISVTSIFIISTIDVMGGVGNHGQRVDFGQRGDDGQRADGVVMDGVDDGQRVDHGQRVGYGQRGDDGQRVGDGEKGVKLRYVSQLQELVEVLLTLVNRPNHGVDRSLRGLACECLREMEMECPGLLSETVGHIWEMCVNEKTHVGQSYVLLLAGVVRGIVVAKVNVGSLSSGAPLVPFNVPRFLSGGDLGREYAGLAVKELRRVMSFLLEWPQFLTAFGLFEFMAVVMPVAVALELQASLLKVQFSGLLYTSDMLLCHAYLGMYLQFPDAFSGHEDDVVRRVSLIARESQQVLVFRLLAVHWLLGFMGMVMLKRKVSNEKMYAMALRFYPTVFDPLALKALKLDLIVYCSVALDKSRLEDANGEVVSRVNGGSEGSVVKLFEDALESVSGFKWLSPWSTETSVAFRTFHKLLIGSSSHSDTGSSTRVLVESTIFHATERKLVAMTLESRGLIPVMAAFINRLLRCHKHHFLGEQLLQTFNDHLLPKVKVDYQLGSYFTLFGKIAENDTVPPGGLLDLLGKYMSILIEKHGLDTGLGSWSQGSKVLVLCRTILMHHQSSRIFLGLSRLLAFTCLHFPDLEVRDNARIYLRMLLCVPGNKLRHLLSTGDQLQSSHSTPFFSVQSPRFSYDSKKSKDISSYIHLERIVPLLVKQSWSLSLASFNVNGEKPYSMEVITDNNTPSWQPETPDNNTEIPIIPALEGPNQSQEPLRVTDSKVSEIVEILRKYFSLIPDFRHMAGIKIGIACTLRFQSEPFNRVWGNNGSGEVDLLHPALYATVLKFSSSAPFGSIPPYRIPFLLGDPGPSTNDTPSSQCQSQTCSLDIVPVNNGNVEEKEAEEEVEEEECFKAHVLIELQPREPTPGLVDVSIEANAENGKIISGHLQSVTVGIEDMFLKALVPDDIHRDEVPGYYVNLFNALWEACSSSSSTGRETFSLKGGKGVTAVNGTRSVKFLEVSATSLIQAVEKNLSAFVVDVIGNALVSIVKDGGIISDIVWNDDDASGSGLDVVAVDPYMAEGPLYLKYDEEEDIRGSNLHINKRNMGRFHILIFLPPTSHLLFQMEVGENSTLVRIRTDHWPCLAYIDDYLEALFLA